MKSVLLAVGLVAWTALVATGFGWLALYESRPGSIGAAAPDWPLSSGLVRDPERWTLLMFVHPRCPCSRASLQELAEVLSENSNRVRAYVVCCIPRGAPPGWAEAATWREASAMKNVEVYCDENDRERSHFGAETSGCVMLYDPKGRLLYSGGITRARGHTGSNAGRSTIESLFRGDSPSVRDGPVFGCPLLDPEISASEKGS
jgi:hypothetical protein